VRLSREYRARLSLDVWAASAYGYGRERARRVREDLGAVRRLLGAWEAEREGYEWHSDAREAGEELAALAEETTRYEALWVETATTPYAGEALKLIGLAENLPRVRRRAYSILYGLGVVNEKERPPGGGLGRAGAERVYHRRERERKQPQQGKRQG
jgi:hypothetical protein